MEILLLIFYQKRQPVRWSYKVWGKIFSNEYASALRTVSLTLFSIIT